MEFLLLLHFCSVDAHRFWFVTVRLRWLSFSTWVNNNLMRCSIFFTFPALRPFHGNIFSRVDIDVAALVSSVSLIAVKNPLTEVHFAMYFYFGMDFFMTFEYIQSIKGPSANPTFIFANLTMCDHVSPKNLLGGKTL